jgi:hypothetical protein
MSLFEAHTPHLQLQRARWVFASVYAGAEETAPKTTFNLSEPNVNAKRVVSTSFLRVLSHFLWFSSENGSLGL